MNTKNNMRTQETKNKIREAAIRLLHTKQISSITIKEICGLSHINRATFYRHYQDVYALFDHLHHEMAERAYEAFFMPTVRGFLPFSRPCFESLFQFVQAHTDYYQALLKQQENAGIVDFLRDRPQNMDLRPLIQTVKLDSSEEAQFRRVYFDGGLNSIVRQWIRSGYLVTPHELAYFMEKEYQYEVAQIERAAREPGNA